MLYVSPVFYSVEYGCHLAWFLRRRRRRAHSPTSNNARHGNHEKINLWVSFSFSIWVWCSAWRPAGAVYFWCSSCLAYLSPSLRAITCPNYRLSITSFSHWISIPLASQLSTLKWFPYCCFLQFLKLTESATDVFVPKKLKGDFLWARNLLLLIRLISNWISCRAIRRVILLLLQIGLAQRACPILKLLGRLLPELY